LIYSVSLDPAEAHKCNRAIDLLGRDDGALSVQVLQEFYVQATRATRPNPLPHGTAVGLIRTWMRFTVQDMSLQIFERALQFKFAHGFSYWDSAIIAAANALGCQTLYTEDMSHGRVVESVKICNPFL
jgi:predicted nucleic acid-binding protein